MNEINIEGEVLTANNFSSFNPMQKKALQRDIFEKNTVISAPTASGKTLIAELCALHSIVKKRKKVVYTCPLRALASEHFNSFRKKYSKTLNIRCAISTGDFDSKSQHLQNYDVIFTTYEKLDSLQRHNVQWLPSVGLLILDEVHEIDSGRGPTLEIVTTKLRFSNPEIKILALSATIPNAKELGKWLNAEVIESDYRPVKLREGVFFGGRINFDGSYEQLPEGKEPLETIALDTVAEKKKQAIIFANTRKRSESIARNMSALTEPLLTPREKITLQGASEKILNALGHPTEQCISLSKLVKKGASFHHAGLMQKQREIIEELFRSNSLKVISATPTLAAGINLPAHTVIIPSLYRYAVYGQQRLPVGEVKQMLGRAGRPQYDTEGRGVLIAKNSIEEDDIIENYINGDIEEVTSHLGMEPVLRTHLLSLVATNFVFDLASLEEFFSKTFYAEQYGNLQELYSKIETILKELEEMKFIKSDEKRIFATPLGRRVSELYLDPFSAHKIITALSSEKKFSELTYLFLLMDTSESQPYFTVPRAREAECWEELENSGPQLAINLETEMFSDPALLRKFNSALVMNEWISETPEQQFMKKFNIQPGILHSKLSIMDWLCYSASELSKLSGLQHHMLPISKLRKRLKYGIREELVMLTELKGIGRVRARSLFSTGIKGIADVKKATLFALSRVLGEKTAKNIKEQLGQSEELSNTQKAELARVQKAGQTALNEF